MSECNGLELLIADHKRCLNPGAGTRQWFKDCVTCPEMVIVPAGEFLMGSNEGNLAHKPVHKVTIARPFAVGRFEVTFAEWDACVRESGCKHRPDDRGTGRGRRPVVEVSWLDVTTEYLPWLARKTGKAYRLLTEAEWEYAARAGTTTRYNTGDTITRKQAQFSKDRFADAKGTVNVGSFTPNRWGLYDVHGNAWEWVADCYWGDYRRAPADGTAAPEAPACERVLRGGSWFVFDGDTASAIRSRDRQQFRTGQHGYGFRVALSLR